MRYIELFYSVLKINLGGNTIEMYCFAVVIFLTVLSALMVFKRFAVVHLGRIAKLTPGDFDDFIVAIISQIGTPVFLTLSFYLAMMPLVLPDFAKTLIKYLLVIVLSIRATFIIQEIVRYGVRKIYLQKLRPGDVSGEAMVKSVTGILQWVIWFVAAIFVLDNMGVNISALVAGIGIGGIAVAMASQAILGDAFSAASIFLDRPFEIGDFIIVDDMMGTVEYIGIKTTRIRSLGGEQLIFSNSDLTKNRIKNYKRMDSRRIVFKFGVIYQTTLDQLRSIPMMIRDIFSTMDGVRLDRAHFGAFNSSSLDYEVVYYVLSADYNIYMDKQQAINLAIMECFAKQGIEFAYPTQTLFLNNQTIKNG